jgi:prolyl oligopeptidase PreP (S9A serine peptidase family)
MLLTTSTRDDRVHPGHARKMVALMNVLANLSDLRASQRCARGL